MSTTDQIAGYFSGRKIIIPLLIGIATALYFFLQDYDVDAYNSISWTATVSFWLCVALLTVVTRILGYAYRIKVLSNGQVSWLRAVQIIVLWEFSSAISPGIVGGTAAALLLLAREKNIDAGRGTAIVLVTSFLDVLFYVLAVPFMFIWVQKTEIIPLEIGYLTRETIWKYFTTIYTIFLLWCLLIGFGLFFKPKAISKFVMLFTRLPLLKRFEDKVATWGENMIQAAKAFRTESSTYWIKAFGATCIAWISRFILVNCLILALGNGVAAAEIFGKQLVMWAALMIPATPGAAGMAEWLFKGFMNNYFAHGQITSTTAFLWRLLSYWPYLFAGLLVFPAWLKSTKQSQ